VKNLRVNLNFLSFIPSAIMSNSTVSAITTVTEGDFCDVGIVIITAVTEGYKSVCKRIEGGFDITEVVVSGEAKFTIEITIGKLNNIRVVKTYRSPDKVLNRYLTRIADGEKLEGIVSKIGDEQSNSWDINFKKRNGLLVANVLLNKKKNAFLPDALKGSLVGVYSGYCGGGDCTELVELLVKSQDGKYEPENFRKL
jgi:hypothetical protein